MKSSLLLPAICGVLVSAPLSVNAVNLALGQSTAQSSTTNGAPSSRAVDGNFRQDWGGGSVIHTAGTANEWWYVDLGAYKAVDAINIRNRSDCCGGRLGNVAVEVLTTLADPAVWTGTLGGGSPGSSAGFTLPDGVEGQFVRISRNAGTAPLNFAEVEVFGHDYGTNVAPLGSAAQSSTGFGGVASRGNDGNPSSEWGDGSVTHTNPGVQNPWYEVSLDQIYSIGDVTAINRGDCCQNRLNPGVQLDIFRGSDNVFSDTLNFTNPTSFTFETGFVKGDRVRLTRLDGSTDALSLAELFVFAVPEPSRAALLLGGFGLMVLRRRR